MNNNVSEDNFLSNIKRGEIIHTNHKMEFLRFFESHKRLCDEISGLKYHHVNNLENKKILIDKINFDLAVRKLNSFIIDYLHYIDESAKREHVWNEFKNLENLFNKDLDYSSFVKNKDNLSIGKEIDFTKKYIFYLMKCFDISFLMSKYLQNSLNIASREIIKNIQFVNYDGFFHNLSIYREEVANDLSNLNFNNLFDNFKKLIGYYYTYRYLISGKEQKNINDLIKLIYNYITMDDVVKYVVKVKENMSISNTSFMDMRDEFVILRDAFNKIYYLCNFSLSMKNILPKSKRDVLIDNTLI